MRFLTADYLFPLHKNSIKEGVLQISDSGVISDILENRKLVPKEKLEIYDGILCPGFINAHCHLELSHLHGFSSKGKGILNFLSDIKNRNNFSQKHILNEIDLAEKQMIRNGIVGVGDICNTDDTLFQKTKKNLQYYNFIEVFSIKNKIEKSIILNAKILRNKFRDLDQKSTISPHAPYSVTPKLMQIIASNFDNEDELITIHIQESKEENELFNNNNGPFVTWLNKLSATNEIWANRNSALDILNQIETKSLLVHNTFAQKKDLTPNYYCTCPKANLYIENCLPNYSIFDSNKLCVGTDSLASNDSLSILEELKIIKENSDYDLNTLLKISSKNGAEALGFSDLGTFEKGKSPGVNLIKDFKEIKVIA